MLQSVEVITFRGDMMEFLQSTQKMRTEPANTLDHELELYDSAYLSYALHYMYQSVEVISLRGDMVEF